MSRRQHPLDGFLASSIKAESETWPLVRQSGLGWRVTLSNEHQDTYTKEGTFPYVPTFQADWTQFWQSVARQTLWEQHLLIAAPIARSITDTNLLEYITAVPLSDRFKVYFGEYPELRQQLDNLSRDDFAAFQHLCKIQYRRMQLGR